MTKPLLMMGSGGHANVLFDMLQLPLENYKAVASLNETLDNSLFSGIEHIRLDDDILRFDCEAIQLVNGIGSLPDSYLRMKIYQKFKALGYHFATVTSEFAHVSSYAQLAEGVQVMAGAIIQAGAQIGENTIINSGAIIEHDCIVGAHNHIAPRATLCGMVKTGKQVHVGAGACIIQGITVGNRVVIAAGATVTRSVPDSHIVYGYRTESKLKVDK